MFDTLEKTENVKKFSTSLNLENSYLEVKKVPQTNEFCQSKHSLIVFERCAGTCNFNHSCSTTFFPRLCFAFLLLGRKTTSSFAKKLILLPRNSRIKPLKTRLFLRQQSTNYENVASLSAFCVFLNHQTRTRTDIVEKVKRMTILRG